MNEVEIRRSIRSWLSNAGRAPAVEDHTPLLEQKVITSLQLAELMLYLEELRGRPIDVEELRPGAFRSVDAIWESFFRPTHAAHAGGAHAC